MTGLFEDRNQQEPIGVVVFSDEDLGHDCTTVE